MRAIVKLRKWMFLPAVALLLLPGSAAAVDCWSHIAATESNLAQVKREVENLPEKKKPRVKTFMADAERLLEEAKRECSQASDGVDRAKAAGKALVAQGNLAAAHLLIKAN
jgi:hypothetical protein